MSNFEHISADKLIDYLKGRSYKYAQVHHTWSPNHADFTGKNHMSLQQGMKNYHINVRKWSDIAQHVTLFPDGTFVTGRPFSIQPAGISGYNTGAFMIEIIGNFDKGHDKFEGEQLKSALKVYNYLTNHNGATIMFHNEHAAKSCPGTGVDKGKFVNAVKNFDGKTVDVSNTSTSKPKNKPTSKPQSTPNVSGSVVDYLVSKGQDSSFTNREKLASKYGISNYRGSASQNTELLNKLKSGSASSKPKAPTQSSYRSVTGSWTGQTLVQGVKGNPVKQLQTKLANNNPPFYPNKKAKNNGIDSYYGGDTANAVKRFQSYYGLTVDSKAGKQVYAKLGGKTSKKTTTSSKLPTGVLRVGDRGNDVRKLQTALASVYYYPNKNAKNNGIDSIFGGDTKNALQRFQSTHGLTQDGVYGSASRSALLKAMK